MNQEDGNRLLAELQGHRREGTMDAKIDFPEKSIAAGLKYLRARYPMDEDAAIIARVDRELQSEFRLPQMNTDQSPYAHSGLEKIRKENAERYDREKASRDEQSTQIMSGDTAVAERPRTLRNLVQRSEEEPEWVRKYREKAQNTEMPQISTFQRLFPSGVFTVAIVVLSLCFAQNYTPPSQQALHDDIGRGPFLALVFASAVLNSYCTMSTYVLNNILTSSTLGASGILTAMIGAACVLHEGRPIGFPMLPAEFTSVLNSGIILLILICIEIIGLRRFGLENTAAIAKHGSATDHLGHLAGYATGITAGALIRTHDPRWQGIERHRYWDWRKRSPAAACAKGKSQQGTLQEEMTSDSQTEKP
ncbi:MAG: hypothetical protein Q9163_001191 [Psora crenata]